MEGEFKEFMELGQKGHDPRYFRKKPKAIAERDEHEMVKKALELYAPRLAMLPDAKRKEAEKLIERNARAKARREAEEKHFYLRDTPAK